MYLRGQTFELRIVGVNGYLPDFDSHKLTLLMQFAVLQAHSYREVQ